MDSKRIYTRTGDRGETGLFGGGRVFKSDPRVEAYGTIDELNAALGQVLSLLDDGDGIAAALAPVQRDLFALGAHLAAPAARGRAAAQLPPLPTPRIAALEAVIDATMDALPPLTQFILPGGAPAGAALHLARTICRRAERRVVALSTQDAVDPDIVRYLNRLSDMLFVLARLANQQAGRSEATWTAEQAGG